MITHQKFTNPKYLLKIGSCFVHSKKAWFLSHINDPYVKKAKQSGYRSRAAFKLLQILSKYPNILGEKIIDLGCSPGSWLQVVQQKKAQSLLVGVDLLKMKQMKGVNFYQVDARSTKLRLQILKQYGELDTILSDIAPNFSGDSIQTHQQIIELNKMCLSLCFSIGSPRCNLVMKTLDGKNQRKFRSFLEYFFQETFRYKPKSSRSHSEQLYYICIKSKPEFYHQQLIIISEIIHDISIEQLHSFKNNSDIQQEIKRRIMDKQK